MDSIVLSLFLELKVYWLLSYSCSVVSSVCNCSVVFFRCHSCRCGPFDMEMFFDQFLNWLLACSQKFLSHLHFYPMFWLHFKLFVRRRDCSGMILLEYWQHEMNQCYLCLGLINNDWLCYSLMKHFWLIVYFDFVIFHWKLNPFLFV